jgi:hypothetical protein
MANPTEEKPPGLSQSDLGNPSFGGDSRKMLEAEVFEQYKKMLEGLPPDERALAVKKLADIKAADRLRQYIAKNGPPAEKKTAPAPQRPEVPVTSEKPLSILDASKWFHWDDEVFSQEKYFQLAGEFGMELALNLRELPSDMQARTYQLQIIKNLFQGKLFGMYCNLYPDRHPEELRQNIQGWLDDRWKEVLASAQKLAGA